MVYCKPRIPSTGTTCEKNVLRHGTSLYQEVLASVIALDSVQIRRRIHKLGVLYVCEMLKELEIDHQVPEPESERYILLRYQSTGNCY